MSLIERIGKTGAAFRSLGDSAGHSHIA